MRRDLEAARRRLTWYGARRWQLRLLTVTESAIVARRRDASIGWLVGVVVGALAASRAGAPVGAVLRESVLSPAGLAARRGRRRPRDARRCRRDLDAGPRREPLRPARRRRCSAAIALVVAALLGGAADQSRLAESQNAGLVLLLLPGLIAFAAAVAAARLFGPLVRLAGRLLHRSVGARLAAVTLGRGPGAAAVTVAFLTLAFALALLAEGYRATLVQAESDQASFAVPLDIVVREDLKSLIPVLDAAPARVAMPRSAGGSDAVPVLRIRGSVGNAEGVSGITVLGLPAAETTQLHGWRSDFSGDSRASLAAAVTPAGRRGGEGDPARLAAPLRCRAGSRLAPGDDRDARRALHVRRARPARGRMPPTHFDRALPARLRGGKLVALELVPPRLVDRGADAGRAAGRHAAARAASPRRRGSARAASSLRPAGDGVELTYRINQQNDARIRARQTTDATPPAVLVTPRLAALVGGVGGTLALEIGGRRVPVRVAAVVDHFPGTTRRGRHRRPHEPARPPSTRRCRAPARRTRSGSTSPPAAPTPRWPRSPSRRSAASSRSPGQSCSTRPATTRSGTARCSRSTRPPSWRCCSRRSASRSRCSSDLRDDRGDLYDLESQGARAALLRRIVRVRALVVGIAGVLAGAAAGALLALLVTRVVSVTARATTPDLPLQTSFDLRVLVVAAVAYLLLAAALVALATRRAFRDDRGPVRAQEAGT